MPADARCKDCGQPPEPGRARCASCAERHRRTEAARRRERRRAQRCVTCGERVASRNGRPARYCPTHLRYFVERARAAAGG